MESTSMSVDDDPRISPPALAVEPGPVAEAERIDSLDVLRGFALLGILVMNIQAFSMIEAAYNNPISLLKNAGWHGSCNVVGGIV
jgi:uncharacterized membrane protein YeiB